MSERDEKRSALQTNPSTDSIKSQDAGRFGALKRLTEQRLGIAWALAFAIGVWALLRTDTIDISRSFPPIGIMLLYVLFGLQQPRKNFVKFADSIYFLGFLWTLVALIDALWQNQVSGERIFLAFAFALLTTGSGMFLRMLLLQFHETLTDVIEDVQDSLDLQARRFADQINSARVMLKELEGSWRRDLGAASDALTLQFAAEEDAIKLATASVRGELSEAGSSLAMAIAGIAQSMTAGCAALQSGVDSTQESVQNARTTLEAELRALSEGLVRARGRIEQELAQAGAAITAIVREGVNVEHLAEASRSATTSLTAVVQASDKLARESGRAVDALRPLATPLTQASTSIEATAKSLTALAEELSAIREDFARRATNEFGQLGDLMRDSTANVQALDRVVSEVLQFARTRIKADSRQ